MGSDTAEQLYGATDVEVNKVFIVCTGCATLGPFRTFAGPELRVQTASL